MAAAHSEDPDSAAEALFASSLVTSVVCNEDLYLHSSDVGDEYKSKRAYWHDPNYPEEPVTTPHNPVLRAINLQLSSAYEARIISQQSSISYLHLPVAWARSQASWRRMLHSQHESAGFVRVVIASYRDERVRELAVFQYEDGKGVGLGDSVDELLDRDFDAYY